MKGKCRLCHEVAELQLSHTIPKFAFKWLKNTSALHIRQANNVDSRVQDSDKEYLLCKKCEQTIGGWEKDFADNIFWPLHSAQRQVYYPYQEWMLKFAVSVSWRVLLLSYERNQLSNLSERNLDLAVQALEVWRRFLFGSEPHPGRYGQHVLPMNQLGSVENTNASPYRNRYLLRTVGDDVCEFDIKKLDIPAFAYSKLGRFIVIGIIHFPSAKRWEGTKLHVRRGVVGSDMYRIDAIMMQYINRRATRAGSSLANMSKKTTGESKASACFKPGCIRSIRVHTSFRARLAFVQ